MSVIDADDALAAAVLAGDREAIVALVERYAAPVTASSAVATGDDAAGRAVAEQVFRRAVDQAERFDRATGFAPALARSASALARDVAGSGGSCDGGEGSGGSDGVVPTRGGGDVDGGIDPVVERTWVAASAVSRVAPEVRDELASAFAAGADTELSETALTERARLERRLDQLPEALEALRDPRCWIRPDRDLAERVVAWAAAAGAAGAGTSGGTTSAGRSVRHGDVAAATGPHEPVASPGAGSSGTAGRSAEPTRGAALDASIPTDAASIASTGTTLDASRAAPGDGTADEAPAWWRTGRIAPAVIGVGAALAVLLGAIVVLSAASGAPPPEDVRVELVSTGLVADVTGGEIGVTSTDDGIVIELEAPTLPRRAGGPLYRAVLELDDGSEVTAGSFNEAADVTLTAGVAIERVRAFRIVRDDLEQRSPGAFDVVLEVVLPRS